jgi:hypothetical protein
LSHTAIRFAYGLNNPVKYQDPSGHCALLEEESTGLCVSSFEGQPPIVQGGSVFPSWVEKNIANYYITNDKRYLESLPPNFGYTMGLSKINVDIALGYQSRRPGLPSAVDPGTIVGAGIVLSKDDGNDQIPPGEGLGYTQTSRDYNTSGSVNAVSSGTAQQRKTPLDILMPGGDPIGEPGRSRRGGVRQLPGGEAEMKRVFQDLTVTGELTPPQASYTGVKYNLPGGGAVGLRWSLKEGWTIDIMQIPGVTFDKIHLP